MDKKIDALLSALDREIDRKCLAIRQERRGRALRAAFVAACALFLVLPALLAFLGVGFFSFGVPSLIFVSVGFCLLSPLIFVRKPGGSER